MLIVEQ
jgi:hypothetical protein